MTRRQMVATDADALGRPSRREPPVKETQAELLRGAAATLAQYLVDHGDDWSAPQRATTQRQIAMCEKAADDVERLAESLRRMATP